MMASDATQSFEETLVLVHVGGLDAMQIQVQ